MVSHLVVNTGGGGSWCGIARFVLPMVGFPQVEHKSREFPLFIRTGYCMKMTIAIIPISHVQRLHLIANKSIYKMHSLLCTVERNRPKCHEKHMRRTNCRETERNEAIITRLSFRRTRACGYRDTPLSGNEKPFARLWLYCV